MRVLGTEVSIKIGNIKQKCVHNFLFIGLIPYRSIKCPREKNVTDFLELNRSREANGRSPSQKCPRLLKDSKSI
jgi:hypothetical protein